MPKLRAVTLISLLSLLLAALAAAAPALRLAQPGHLLRGLERRCSNASTRPQALRPAAASWACTRCASSSTGPSVAPSRDSATRPSFDATDPANYDWSAYDPLLAEAQRLALAGAADGHLAGAALGHLQPQSAVRDAARTTRPSREFMTAVGRHFGSQVVGVLDLERAEPPRVPAAAVQLERHPRLAAHLPRPLPGRLRRACRRPGSAHPRVLFGETAPTGYDARQNVRREGSLHDVAPLAFLREALCLNAHYRKSRSCGPAADRVGYAHHAYTMRRAAELRLAAAPTTSRSARSRGSRARSTWLRARTRSPLRPADLPHRVRRPEQAQQAARRARRAAGRIRRDGRTDRLGRTRAWSPSRSTCSKTTRSGARRDRACTAARSASRPASSTSNGKPKPLYSAWPRAADRVARRRSGFSLWGLVRPATGATTVTVLVRRKGSHSLPHAAHGVHELARLLVAAAPPRAAKALAGALDQPGRREVRRPADPGLLGATARRERPARRRPLTEAARRQLGVRGSPGVVCLRWIRCPSCPRSRSQRACSTTRSRGDDRVGAGPRDQRAEDASSRPSRRSRARRIERRSPARQAPDRRDVAGGLALLIHLMSAGRLQLYDKPRGTARSHLAAARAGAPAGAGGRRRRRRGRGRRARAAPAGVRLQAGGVGEAPARAPSSTPTSRLRGSGPRRGPSLRRSVSCSTRRGRCTRCCATST